MDKKTRLIIIGVLSIIIVILLSLGLTKAFMKPVEQGGNLTEISLESCAKIKLTGTSSINLSSSYPMSRNRGLQTTPYSLTVTSYCDSYVGFNLYIATLNTNTLTDENIHYILTEKGSKTAVVEGILSSATDGSSDFSDTDKTELNTGLKGTYSKIYSIHNESLTLKGNKQYDLYLFVDESSTNTSMNKTFKAGVAVKSYDRETVGLEMCTSGQNLSECVISYANSGNASNIYYHDSSLTNGAGDNSYRYAGPSDSVNNFVCFGSTTSPCPIDNLYRIIGVFGENYHGVSGKQLVKLIKYDYNTKEQLGEDGDYEGSYTPSDYSVVGIYIGSQTTLDVYFWNYNADPSNYNNTWSTSLLNKTNLNTNFINNIGTTWANKIATTTWKVGGNTYANIRDAVPSIAYQNEVVNPVTTNTTDNATEYSARIGLMYASDYGFAAVPEAWTTILYNYNGYVNGSTISSQNWMYMGMDEWTISRFADDLYSAFNVCSDGFVKNDVRGVGASFGVRVSFSLEFSVNYVSGSGSMSDPVRIN